MISIAHRVKDPNAGVDLALSQAIADLRCHLPGTVISFDPGTPGGRGPTCSVQVAIRDRLLVDGIPTDVAVVPLKDVPVQFPRGGGFSMTWPLQAGDEVLLCFADQAIDTWWQNGGLQSAPADFDFRHEIGDAIAIPGLTSCPRALSNFSTDSLQLRSDDGAVFIDVAGTEIKLRAPSIVAESAAELSQGLVQAAFYTWFTTVFMPRVMYTAGPPPVPPTPAPVTSILKGE